MQKLKPFKVKLNSSIERQSLLGKSGDTVFFRSGQVVLKPGESVGEHSTKEKEELIVILEGEAEVSSEGNPLIHAQKDCVCYMPPETAHNVKNTGSGVLRYIYIVSTVNKGSGS